MTKIKRIFSPLGNLLLIMGFVLTWFLWVVGITSSFAAEGIIIAVIKSRDASPYNTALEGFCKELNDRGIDAYVREYNIKESWEEVRRVVGAINAGRPELVLTLGSLATKIAQQNIKDIPIVFSMVLNPVASNFIKSIESSSNNLTGASMDIPIRHQFENLKAVFPSVRRIGVVYDPKETGVVVEQALKVAKEMGLELISEPVSSERDVIKVVKELGERIDCLWAVADSTVFTSQSIRLIILHTLRSRIPFMGLSSYYVKAGALLALSWDYEDIGRQSGELAVEVLTGQKPNELPITIPRKTFLSLNLRTAERIGIEIPPDVLNRAKEVFR